MRIKVNHSCNVCTEEHSNAYRSAGRAPAAEITVPSLRIRLSVSEAEALAKHLTEAIAVAQQHQPKP